MQHFASLRAALRPGHEPQTYAVALASARRASTLTSKTRRAQVRSVLRHRKRNGGLRCANPPYGLRAIVVR